jgi:hypothetical protein
MQLVVDTYGSPLNTCCGSIFFIGLFRGECGLRARKVGRGTGAVLAGAGCYGKRAVTTQWSATRTRFNA